MLSTTEEFIKKMAFYNVEHCVESPSVYKMSSYRRLFNLLTGDTPYSEFPRELQEDIGSDIDLKNLAADLNEAYSTVLYTLRELARHGQSTIILGDLLKND